MTKQPILSREEVISLSEQFKWYEADVERFDILGFADALQKRVCDEPRDEVTDDDKRDAARWRAGVAMKRFPQFAYFNGGRAEGKIQGEGPHWYVVTREERYPKRFNTAEEAIDAARTGVAHE